jgi:hypothetical protein
VDIPDFKISAEPSRSRVVALAAIDMNESKSPVYIYIYI